MKRLILGLALLLATASQAFESGTYKCPTAIGPVLFILQNNGAVIYDAGAFGKHRGRWTDYVEDAEITIRGENKLNSLRKVSANKYILNYQIACIKIK